MTALVLLPLLAATPARAQSSQDTAPLPSESVQRRRDYLMEVNVRGRYLSVPDSVLDIWFFDSEDANGTHPDRPKVQGYAVGLEYVMKKDSANGIFYFEYGGSMMKEGYWDDVEEPPNYNDGDYIVPDRFGMIDFGADYAYELHANPWLSFLFGGGLGVAVITGQLTQWNPGPNATGDPDCSQGSGLADPYNATAWERYEAGCGDDGPKRVPGVLPMVDINFGMRFNFNDRANLRFEGGFHDMLYLGMATGIVF